MHELVKLQQFFYNNIFNQDTDLGFISSNFPKERFEIYRQTIFENMINALKITYPGVWKLLGRTCANSVAYAYSKTAQNLPKTGCLDDFGEDFSQFLSTLEQLSELAYLRDYAHYEWLKHLAYIAPDSKPVDPSDLMSIPEGEIDHVRFHFCPSVYLFHSKYPLFDIHEIVKDASAKSITLKQEEAYGIISRQNNDIHTYWTAEDKWHLIKKLFEGATLLESVEYAQTINNNFDLSSAIAFVLQAQLVDKIIYNGGKNAH
jgi:hypothetical protein